MAITIKLFVILMVMFFMNFYFINKKQYHKVFIMMFFILIMIPPEITGIFSGVAYNAPGKFNISLMGYDIIVAFICFITINKGKLYNIPKKKFFTIMLSLMLMLIIRFTSDGFDALSNKMIDNYFAPILLAIMIIEYLPKDKINKVLNSMYILILFNAIVAVNEYVVGKSLFFHEYYIENLQWYQTIYKSTFYGVPFRCTALLGHPLTNGIYYIIAIIYLYNKTEMKFGIKKILQLIILVFAIFSTNSRMDMAILILYTLYKLIKEKKIFPTISVVLVGIVMLLFVDFREVYGKMFSRDSNGSSIAVRILAITSFLKIPISTLCFGAGYNNTKYILTALGFSGNLEISYFIIFLENGLFGFITWIIMIFSLYSYNMEKSYLNINFKAMINEMFCCFAMMTATSNSIGDPGTLNYMLWIILAFSFVMSIEKLNVERKVVNGKNKK